MGWFGATSQNNYAEISCYLFLILPQRNPGLAQHPGLPVKHFMRHQLNISEKLHETLKPEAYQFARIQVAIRARDPKLALRPQLQARTAPHSLESSRFGVSTALASCTEGATARQVPGSNARTAKAR